MKCEEVRVDMREVSQYDLDEGRRTAQMCYRLNHAMPMTKEYDDALRDLFEDRIGEGSHVSAPVSGAALDRLIIGKNVFINSNLLAMARGGITIGNNVQIAANVQLISNNHDVYDRQVLLCKPILIREGAWIGAGATILPGVCVGKYAIVGACAVVTKDVPDYAVVVGSPAKVVKTLEAERFENQEKKNTEENTNMKIAVPYNEGNIFQHFGKTESFKIYEADEGKIISSKVISPNGLGHEALVWFLAEMDVEEIVCGGLGGGAMEACEAAGIKVTSGAQGDADEAVRAYLNGELESAGVNCDHHDHEHGHDGAEEDQAEESGADEGCGGCGGGCGGDSEEGCGGCGGGGCGGCGGCGGEPVISLEGRNAGKTCRVHYRGTFNDGTEFDSSYGRGEPMEFLCGAGRMIKGFDKAVVDMEPGQKVNIHLMPEEAYGMPNPNQIFSVELDKLEGSEGLSVGMRIGLMNTMGQHFPVTVVAKDEKTITFDANHEMAGKELNFEIELLEVLD